jgi:hypothetical protein
MLKHQQHVNTCCNEGLLQMSLEPAFEIVAHSRYLSTLQMHAHKPWLLPAAHDGTLAVWRLPKTTEGQEIHLVGSYTWQNNMMVGGTFVDEDKIAVTAYSNDEVRMLDLQA